jgi:iron(III) transport system substrate-binding protein
MNVTRRIGHVGHRLCTGMLFAVSLLIGAPAWADWKQDWDKTVAEAKGQKLNLIIQPSEGMEAVVKVFKQRFPQIDVQVTLMHPSDAGPRVLTEQKNNLYNWDTWWSTASNMNNVVLPAGGLEKITDYFILPEVKDESNWRAPAFSYTSPRGPYVFVHTHLIQNLSAYNKNMVKGAATFDSLLDPALKGKIYIRQPSRPHGGTMMLAQVAKEKGIGFVEKLLTTMDPVYVDNDRQNFMAVQKGQAAIALGTPEATLAECWEQGGCANMAPLGNGFMHSRGVSVFKNAPHKAATKVWINWLLSKDGQEAYVREWAKDATTGAHSLRKDVAGDPKHAASTPDFNNLDKYTAVSLDSGTAELKQIIDLYTKVRKASADGKK